MTCPMCNGDTDVTCTRDNEDHVIRYRKCQDCGYRFTTVETDEDFYSKTKKGRASDKGKQND